MKKPRSEAYSFGNKPLTLVGACDALVLSRALGFWVNVGSPLRGRFVFLHLDSMRVGISIVANARYLPRDSRARLPTHDPEHPERLGCAAARTLHR